MRAEIVSIGDELLKGQRVNTNAATIAAGVQRIGLPVGRITACSDELGELQSALGDALDRAELVLCTGGLGPTSDDRTRTAVQQLLGRGLEFCPEAWARIEARLRSAGRTPGPVMRSQAMVVEGSEPIPNSKGTATGMIIPGGERWPGRFLVLMPGVPVEMEAMMQERVLPRFSALSGESIVHTEIRTVGIGESSLAELIAEVEGSLPEGSTLAYLPYGAGVNLMVSTRRPLREEAQRDNKRVVRAIRSRAAAFIYGLGEASFEETIGSMLLASGRTLSVAESCTGGLIASRLTDVSGSSSWFMEGVVTYSNEAKQRLLGVPSSLIESHGAVSEQVAEAMACGSLERAGTGLAVSATGIAGPGGGSEEKPVGTLCVGLAMRLPDGSVASHARSLCMQGDRRQNKFRFSQAALRELWEALRAGMAPDGEE